MEHMRISPVTAIGDRRDRARRVSHAVSARRRLERSGDRRRSPRGAGRVWLNGHELGGTEPRFAHLSQSFD
jgi:hypothetical protein